MAAVAAPDGAEALSDPKIAKLAPTIAKLLQSNVFFRNIHELQDAEAAKIATRFKLSPADTKLTSKDGAAVFSSADNSSQFVVEVFGACKDSPVLWMVRPTVALGPILAGGRLNVFMAGGNTYAPNLDIELYSYGFSNKLFMYVNLVPRRSLIQNPDDIQRIYLTAPPSGGKTFHDIYLELEGDPATWEHYYSKDAYLRVLLSTGLIYQTAATPENQANITAIVQQVIEIWTALAQDESFPRPETHAEKEALKQTDYELQNYARRDPQNPQAVGSLGQANFDKLLDLLTRNSSIFDKHDGDGTECHGNGNSEGHKH